MYMQAEQKLKINVHKVKYVSIIICSVKQLCDHGNYVKNKCK